jgi:hypothetical protein
MEAHRVRLRDFCTLLTLVLLLIPGIGLPQDTHDGPDPHRLVEFDFTNSDIAEVLRRFVQLTGWPVFYDPTQVRGRVTIITPGKIPLAQAIGLVQGVMRSHGYAMQVLTPNNPQPVPLATVLAAFPPPPERRDVIVWHNSNACSPQPCPHSGEQQETAYPLLPFWINVIVDKTQ